MQIMNRVLGMFGLRVYRISPAPAPPSPEPTLEDLFGEWVDVNDLQELRGDPFDNREFRRMWRRRIAELAADRHEFRCDRFQVGSPYGGWMWVTPDPLLEEIYGDAWLDQKAWDGPALHPPTVAEIEIDKLMNPTTTTAGGQECGF